MKAMIFAAGVGSRLRPFTLEHPKALAPVGGRPILERVVRNVVAAGAEAGVRAQARGAVALLQGDSE